MSRKVEVIRRLSTNHDVNLLCGAFNISRSTYYASLNKKQSKRYIENEKIKDKIGEIYEWSKKRYGCIKIKHALEKHDVYIKVRTVCFD